MQLNSAIQCGNNHCLWYILILWCFVMLLWLWYFYLFLLLYGNCRLKLSFSLYTNVKLCMISVFWLSGSVWCLHVQNCKKKKCCFNFSCSLVVGFVCPSKALPIVLSWPHNVLFTLNQIWMEENKDMLNLNHSKGLCTLLCINLCIFIFPSCCLNPCKCFLRQLRTLCELWVIATLSV